jgi:hypothetical protein
MLKQILHIMAVVLKVLLKWKLLNSVTREVKHVESNFMLSRKLKLTYNIICSQTNTLNFH